MRIYQAGATKKRIEKGVFRLDRLMLSYHYHRDMIANMSLSDDVMLDSGAYSAFTKGIHIDIGEYVAFVREQNIKLYINLDVVGDGKQSDINLKILESEGLNPIPVYPYQAHDKGLLYRYLDNYEYMCIGGLIAETAKMQVAWRLCELLPENPQTKIHLLGYTRFAGLQQLNGRAYSADSSLAIQAAKYGNGLMLCGRRFKLKGKTMDERIKHNVMMQQYQAQYLATIRNKPNKHFIY